MFITKQILNLKQKKMKSPHTRQIFSQIYQSSENQKYLIQKYIHSQQQQDNIRQKKRTLRPNTTNFNQRKSKNNQNYNKKRPLTSQVRLKTCQSFRNYKKNNQGAKQRSQSFLSKVEYKIQQMKSITQSIDKQKHFIQKQKCKIIPQNHKLHNFLKEFHKNVENKQNQKKNHQFEKYRNQIKKNNIKEDKNQYLGFFKQKLKSILPCKKLKNEDFRMVKRCITGGYISEFDDYSDTISKSDIQKLKKEFITFEVVYNGIKGKKNKGLQNIKPEEVESQNLKNLIYYIQNENQLNIFQKNKMKSNLKLCS